MATTKNDKDQAIKDAERLGHNMPQFDTGIVGISTIRCGYCGAEVSVAQDPSTPYRKPWGRALDWQCPRAKR